MRPSLLHRLIEIIFLFCHYGIAFKEFLSFVRIRMLAGFLFRMHLLIWFSSFYETVVTVIRNLRRPGLPGYILCTPSLIINLICQFSQILFAFFKLTFIKICVLYWRCCHLAASSRTGASRNHYKFLPVFVYPCTFPWMSFISEKKCNRIKFERYCLKSKTDGHVCLSSRRRRTTCGACKKTRR